MYTKKNCWLYVATDNAQNFMVLMSREAARYLVFTWDVTDDEIAEIAEKFYSTGLEDGLDLDNDTWTDGVFYQSKEFNWFEQADIYVERLPWYAVLMDEDDTDWGTGSHSRSKALRMAIEMGAARIAKIDGSECVDIEDMDN
jgi:hypothetical protein